MYLATVRTIFSPTRSSRFSGVAMWRCERESQSVTNATYIMAENYLPWIGEQIFRIGKAELGGISFIQSRYSLCSGSLRFILQPQICISFTQLPGRPTYQRLPS